MLKPTHWKILGPLFVIIGAALWGLETPFRVQLNSHFDSEVLVFHEHLLCILFTFPLLFMGLSQARKAPRSCWIYLFLSGSVGSAIGTVFFTLSLTELNFSVANVLLNFQPIVSVTFAAFLLKEKLGKTFYVWAGLALLAGLVIVTEGFRPSEFKFNIGLLYIFITALAWGFSTVAGRGAMIGIPLSTATACRFMIGAVVLFFSLLIKGKFTEETLKWNLLLDPQILRNFLLLSFLAGVLPLYFYFKGLSKTPASVGGFCEMTQTLSALIVTWGFMGQPLSVRQSVAGIILLFCVYMVNVGFAKANSISA